MKAETTPARTRAFWRPLTLLLGVAFFITLSASCSGRRGFRVGDTPRFSRSDGSGIRYGARAATNPAPPPVWSRLESIPPGDELLLRKKDGVSVKGRLRIVSDSMICVARGDKSFTYGREEIQQVYRVLPKSGAKWALLGGALGAGIFATAALTNPWQEGYGPLLVGTPLFGGIGVGVGAAFGLREVERVLLYDSDDAKTAGLEGSPPSANSPATQIAGSVDTFGRVSITSNTWAQVSLDGGTFEETPIWLERVPVGTHEIRAFRSGYELQVLGVRVDEGKTTFVKLRMEKKP